ncbi:MAG: class I SAM-dependent methyltransferase [Chitinophagales bacterium]
MTITEIYNKIASINPIHGKKLDANFIFFNEQHDYKNQATEFLKKYTKVLNNENKDFSYAIQCYLKMIADFNEETLNFMRSGKYKHSSFDEVNKAVYDNPDIMEYHMHGLLLSQFLWKHHYQIYNYFKTNIADYKNSTNYYLEIGAGHGLYLEEALRYLNPATEFSVVDISQTSIELTKSFIEDDRVNYNLIDIFDFTPAQKYDFITMGEVLEHVEDPLRLLNRLYELLSDNGTIFITTPTNAPSIDHIYLFNNVQEIRDLISKSGFVIKSENSFISEDVSIERAEKRKITILYGAFLTKIK